MLQALRTTITLFLLIILISILSCDENPVESDNFKPVVIITFPYNGFSVLTSDQIQLHAKVKDPEEGDIAESRIIWTSNIDGQIGTGADPHVVGLSVAKHNIVVTATDSNGGKGIDSIIVYVTSDSDPVVDIISPSTNIIHDYGSPLVLSAVATDVEDGIMEDSEIHWSSDVDGILGSGSALSVNSLTENLHHIWCEVQDSDRNRTLDSITVDVRSLPKAFFLSPGADTSIYPGDRISLSGFAIDSVDGVLTGNNIRWSSDKDGILGYGVDIELFNLSENVHDVSMYVWDSDGNSTTIHRNIYVTKSWFNLIDYQRGDDGGHALVATDDSGCVVIGNQGTQIYVEKFDKRGASEWQMTKRPGNGMDIFPTSDGGYICCAISNFPNRGDDYFIFKLDNAGNNVWSDYIGGTGREIPLGVCETRNTDIYGGYVIIGTTESYGAGEQDIYIVKVYYDGSFGWEKVIGDIYYDYGFDVIPVGTEDLLVSGVRNITDSTGNRYARYIAKLDKFGEIIWENTSINCSANYTAVSETSAGNYLITGTAFNSGVQGVKMVLLDPDGNLIQEDFLYQAKGAARSIVETKNGDIIIAGYLFIGPSEDMFLMRVSSEGEIIWNKIFDNPNHRDNGWRACEAADGGIFLVGDNHNENTGFDIVVLKTDSAGNIY